MTQSEHLQALGWSPYWEAQFSPHADTLTPARVVRSDRGSSLVALDGEVIRAKPSVRLVKASAGPVDQPVAGDWVAVQTDAQLEVPLIDAVLERRSAITRGDPGKNADAQILAANVDTVFVVHPIAEAPNLRRIERELSLAWDSGAIPVVVLTKADLSADPGRALATVQGIAIGVDVHLVNALDSESAAPLLSHISDRRTAVLIGPSGAGKSTLTNALLGEHRQDTQEIRLSDGRGRHTTVTRELIAIPDCGLIIDTPGLRSLGLTGSEDGIANTFPDIEELGGDCRFRDCTHTDEPGCQVLAAVESGDLPPERLASYHKLLRETRAAAMKTDIHLRHEETRKWKTIAKWYKNHPKNPNR